MSAMKVSGRLLGALLASALAVGEVSGAQVVAGCGASTGYGYYLEPKRDGWVSDGISSGSLTIVRDSAAAYDVIIKDAQTPFSAKGDGGRVFKVDGQDDQRFTLLIVYPHPVTEMYQFTLDEGGRGTVIW